MLSSHEPERAPDHSGENSGGMLFGAGPLILIVDDSPVNQRIASTYLEELGCRVEITTNGAEALEVIVEKEFDLIFMDCAMPVMDGFEATRLIREHDELRGCRTIIVALTSKTLDEDRLRCLECGMDDYLPKPATSEQLKEVLEKWLPEISGDSVI